jgi:hypothetical protein
MMAESVEKSGGIFKYITNSQTSQEKNNSSNTINTKSNVPMIIVDYKEKESGVVQTLANTDILIKLENLDIGDYIIGDLIIERKKYIGFH